MCFLAASLSTVHYCILLTSSNIPYSNILYYCILLTQAASQARKVLLARFFFFLLHFTYTGCIAGAKTCGQPDFRGGVSAGDVLRQVRAFSLPFPPFFLCAQTSQSLCFPPFFYWVSSSVYLLAPPITAKHTAS